MTLIHTQKIQQPQDKKHNFVLWKAALYSDQKTISHSSLLEHSADEGIIKLQTILFHGHIVAKYRVQLD